MKFEELKNKKIAIVGFAREGKDTFKFLLKRGFKRLAVFDEKPGAGITDFKLLKDYDVVIKTPGIPESKVKPFLNKKAKLTSQTELFFDNFKGVIVGITGTKGKGTTATLIYEILKQEKRKVCLVGNIGYPVLGKYAESDTIFVYELSSHQLQGIKKSPHIAVFLNLFPDHLDYYQSLKEYEKAKEGIALFQKKDDFFVYNSKDKRVKELAKKSKAKKIAFDRTSLKIKTPLKGDFNLLNIKAAWQVGKLLRIRESIMKKAIARFKGLEHRLEYVGKYQGIDFYNDSMSTLPEVAIKAIEAVLPKTLIAGGSDKGSDYREMAKAIIKYKVRTLILLGEGTSSKIEKELDSPLKVFKTNKMKEAVRIAFKETKKGETCLLSPGSASFNLFKSYADRGEQFKKYASQKTS